MKFNLSAEEYSNAVKSALDFIGGNAASSQAHAMELVLASVCDTVACANTIGCLVIIDSQTRDIALSPATVGARGVSS